MDKQVLRGIQVDKTHRPLEEQIEFDAASDTSLKWLRRFSASNAAGDEKLGAKLNEKLKLNIDENKLREQLASNAASGSSNVEEETFHERTFSSNGNTHTFYYFQLQKQEILN